MEIGNQKPEIATQYVEIRDRPDHEFPITYDGFVMDQRKMFWIILTVLSLIADFALPLVWGLIATIPLIFVSWWIVYRSGWV